MSKTRRWRNISEDQLRYTKPYKRRRYPLDNLMAEEDERWLYT